MKKCRTCALPDRWLLLAKGEPTDVQKYIFLLELNSHVMPTWAGAMVGIYGCGIQASSISISKPDIAYRGGVGPSLRNFGLSEVAYRGGCRRLCDLR